MTAADPIPLGSGTAAQSSQLGGFDAGRALDANVNFTHTTSGDQNPTWQVLLPNARAFGVIEISNRQASDGATNCCPSRLRDITIQVVTFDGDPLSDFTGAGGSDNAWCTNLGDYGPDSDISLRSPAIDLTNLPGALLSFDAFRDADGFADEATVRFLRADDQTQLGADVPIDMTVFDIDYLNVEVPVPAEAIGESILVEFNFLSDGGGDLFSGLTRDNISVKAN